MMIKNSSLPHREAAVLPLILQQRKTPTFRWAFFLHTKKERNSLLHKTFDFRQYHKIPKSEVPNDTPTL